jgi:hypothetical protein
VKGDGVVMKFRWDRTNVGGYKSRCGRFEAYRNPGGLWVLVDHKTQKKYASLLTNTAARKCALGILAHEAESANQVA